MKNSLATLILGPVLALGMISFWISPGAAWAGPISCSPVPFEVVMATPFSSRIDRIGDPLQAVLVHDFAMTDTHTLPAGTMLKGKVTGLRLSDRYQAGQIQVRFTQAAGTTMDSLTPLSAVLATVDGWLHQEDADTPVWHVSLSRSTRLLNMMIERRLGTNRAVWAQILGIHENTIPDPGTDEFIWWYHRHDVLVGTGDQLLLRLQCASQ